MRHAAPPSLGHDRKKLAEVQALRAVAVGLVIVFHLWPAHVPGGYVGVDVFFVISGFLITAHLVRELDATGSVDLPRFWARRIRRLLPAAVVVLVATLAAVLALTPQAAWQRTVVEIAAAAGYVLNWLLATNAVDYFAAENAATPVQHYWSLSVEEQFYLVWPVLLLGLAVLARRRAGPLHPWLLRGVLLVAGASLAYSIWFTSVSPSAAYFSTLTHAWEFAGGAILALSIARLATTRWAAMVRTRALVSIAGFAAIIVCGFTLTGATPFPGWIALVPVTATLAVIAAADTSRSLWSPMPLLSARPVQLVGDLSYSAYLWHWPPIVLLPFALGRPLSLPMQLAVLVSTFAAAWASKRFVEDPLRAPRRRARAPRPTFRPVYAAAAVSTAVLVATSGAVWAVVDHRVQEATQTADAQAAAGAAGLDPCFGAAAVLSDAQCENRYSFDPELVLATTTVTADEPRTTFGGRLQAFEYGNRDADTVVAVVGDSHAGHYVPAVRALAEQHDWRVLLFRHNNCTPSAPTWQSPVDTDMSDSCQQYRRDLMEVLPGVGVDVVLTSSVAPRYQQLGATDAELEEIAAAFRLTWQTWVDAGIPVIVLADVPGPAADVGEVRECVAQAEETEAPCTSPRDEVVGHDPMVPAARGMPGVTLLDWTDAYCDAEVCHSVIGGVVVYSGGAHISELFARSLAPYIGPHVLQALGSPPAART
ncbi:MAG: acyltransferase [Cellulomonas sp.]|uniref:acyltransferase family protein n=1 Tax=Cellulomonas sp. TaxID=40001 RepID=UPI0019FADCF2|nr:acyltransferase family protein [Cellulomonas sp.]MBF0686169.1 acyltransferase [Cellulomonas sp.]